jgi:hypothetical protein
VRKHQAAEVGLMINYAANEDSAATDCAVARGFSPVLNGGISAKTHENPNFEAAKRISKTFWHGACIIGVA